MIIHIYNTIKKQLLNRNISNIFLRILEIFYGYPLLLLSYLTPRDKNKIVVGSHTPFNDNSKYFFLLSQDAGCLKRIIWISHTKNISKKINSLGYEAYYKWSIKGIYHSLTAKIYVFTFHLIDINLWTSGNTIKINLWHGIPLKDIEFMVSTGSSVSIYNEKNIISRIFALYIFIRPDYLLSTSPEISKYLQKAFRLKYDSQLLEYGMPRCDIFFYSKEKLILHIKKYEKEYLDFILNDLSKYKKVFIYMPTWRDYDFFEDAQFDFNILNHHLALNNILFLLKVHPATKIDLKMLGKLKNIIVLKNDTDVYPILPFTDCLITDYSSIYYDYLLLKKEIILFPCDYEKYTTIDRGFIYDYNIAMPSKKVFKFNDLLDNITPNITIDNNNAIINHKWSDYDGNATNKILNSIKVM